MDTLTALIARTHAAACLECGKCTAVCPLARHDEAFSPRRLVEELVQGRPAEALRSLSLWSCLTCRACQERCPQGVDYGALIRGARALARREGERPPCSHGGLLQTVMRLQASPGHAQKRLEWLQEDLEVSSEGETLYFVGCLPYFQVIFSELEVPALEIARSVVRLLNAAGEHPQVRAEERCCGHDLLWEGDVESFRRLAEQNRDMVQQSGARRIVTACPECAYTLAVDYPALGYGLGVEVLHLSQWLAQALREGRLHLQRGERRLTYQDPCRLSRYLGEVEAPRQVLAALGEVVELEGSGRLAVCCGGSWTECGAANRALQVERLDQAGRNGADLLVTACIKCQFHFRCAQKTAGLGEGAGRTEVQDLALLAAQGLGNPGWAPAAASSYRVP
ncbi:MAG: (Fe-S)-binding protein [Chloroflexia bacterium]